MAANIRLFIEDAISEKTSCFDVNKTKQNKKQCSDFNNHVVTSEDMLQAKHVKRAQHVAQHVG